MRHLDEGLLQAWLDGSRGGLTDEEGAAVAEHLASCPECAVRLEELRDTSDQAVELLGPLEASDDEIPDFEAVVARSREIGAARGARRRWVAPAWAASVAVALGVGWLGNEMSRTAVEPEVPSEESTEAAAAIEAERPPVTAATEREREIEAAGPPRAEPESEVVAAAPSTIERPDPVVGDMVAPAPTSERIQRARAQAPEIAPSPEPLVVRGRVVDAASGRPLETVQISFPQLRAGGLTNAEGEFEIELGVLPDTVRRLEMRTELIGYTAVTQALALGNRDTVSSDVRLEGTALSLQELVVTGTAGDASTGGLLLTEAPSIWRPVTLEEAEAWVGFPVRTVPGLEVVDVRIHAVGETPVVRVTQRLDGGDRLVVFQARRLEGLADLGEPDDGLATLELDDGVWALARAPLPAGSILALLERIR